MWLQDKVEILEYHGLRVHSPSQSFQLPSVIRLKQYIRPYFCGHIKLSRQNIFLRDNMTCQYCYQVFHEKRLTIDHVLPLSKGGCHEWTNVVAACSACNNKKGNKTPEQAKMKLLNRPRSPRWLPCKEIELKAGGWPDQWLAYLPEKVS